MKGFKPSVKNFNFPTSADAAHKGKPMQMVRPHFRAKSTMPPMKKAFAEGGAVTGNATVQRSKPVTDFDASDGGKGSLRTGYKKGGSAKKGC